MNFERSTGRPLTKRLQSHPLRPMRRFSTFLMLPCITDQPVCIGRNTIAALAIHENALAVRARALLAELIRGASRKITKGPGAPNDPLPGGGEGDLCGPTRPPASAPRRSGTRRPAWQNGRGR